MCGSKYVGAVVNQGYHLEDTYPKTDKKVGRAELEEIYRAEQIEAACKIRQNKEKRRFKGY